EGPTPPPPPPASAKKLRIPFDWLLLFLLFFHHPPIRNRLGITDVAGVAPCDFSQNKAPKTVTYKKMTLPTTCIWCT
ncbi:hypothetical protein ACVGXT_08875, partial [Enterobacter intestinihominis]